MMPDDHNPDHKSEESWRSSESEKPSRVLDQAIKINISLIHEDENKGEKEEPCSASGKQVQSSFLGDEEQNSILQEETKKSQSQAQLNILVWQSCSTDQLFVGTLEKAVPIG